MSQPGLVAGTQCQSGREARLRNNIMRSKPSCSRYGAARLRRERAIWIFWKVIEVIIIRGDRRERQQREGKRHVECVYFQWNLQGGQETKKRFFFSFLKGSFLQSTMITRVSRTVEGQEDCETNFESQELRNVTVCLRNIWLVWVSYWNLGIVKFRPMNGLQGHVKCQAKFWVYPTYYYLKWGYAIFKRLYQECTTFKRLRNLS